MKDNKIEPTEENDEEYFKQVIALKEKNPNLKVMLAVGGWYVIFLTFSKYRSTLFFYLIFQIILFFPKKDGRSSTIPYHH